MTLPADVLAGLPTRNYFRYDEILPGLYFVSVDSGDWLFLDEPDLRRLQDGSAGEELRRRLERAYVYLTADNAEAYERRLASRYFFLGEGPTLHILVVTRTCNLACIYCQASSGRGRAGTMSASVARQAVERALETPARSLIIEFQGGEPTLAMPVVQEAILHARARAAALGKRVELSLISNFTEVVTEEAMRFLLENRVSVCFSLDGPEWLQDRNRGSGCFAAVRENVERFRQLWREVRGDQPVLRALLTTTLGSLDAADEIVRTYDELGLDTLALRPITPVGRARGSLPDLHYAGSDFLAFWKRVVTLLLSRRVAGTQHRESHLELFLQKLFADETGHMDIRSPCGAAIGQIVYDVDGSIYTCDEGRMLATDRFRLGHVGAPLTAALASARAREIQEASIAEQYECDLCAYKPYCGVCPVLHFVEEGTPVGDPCAQRRCETYRGMLRHILQTYATDPEARAAYADIVAESW